MMKPLAIIIVSYNSKEFLADCLDSLQLALKNIESTVIVVDNGGTDGTAAYVKQSYPWCVALSAANNGGYAYGNNLGLRWAGFPDKAAYRYALLLNPDTIIPPNAITSMLTYIEGRSEVGALGPKLVLSDGSLDKACKRGIPTPATSFFHFAGLGKLFPHNQTLARYNMSFVADDQIAEVDSLVGACSLYRSEAIQKSGLMDETFFMYGEDLDLNLRVQQAGYQIVYYPPVVIQHLKGTSTRKEPEKMIRAFYDAMKIFHKKHFSAHYPRLFNLLIYTAIDSMCRFKLFRNRLRPEHERVVGSAKSG